MGNEVKSKPEENQEEKNPDQIQKEEIPADTQLNNDNEIFEKQINPVNYVKEEEYIQDPGHLLIKEQKYENNDNGVHTTMNQRKIEYHISKINKENYENDEKYETGEQMVQNAIFGDQEMFDINQQQELENEGYHIQKEYKYNNQQNNNMDINNIYYNENEPETKIIINKLSGNSNKNIYLPYTNYSGRYTQYYTSNIPRFMTFQKTETTKGATKLRNSINVVKTENISELIEIPKSEYPTYEGRETVFIGGGMETGEYKFRGQGIVITQKGEVEENIAISEEEILKEINRRKNKPKKEKRRRYEILDKFYAKTEFDGKPIYKAEKIEQLQKQNEYNQQMKMSSSGKSSNLSIKMNNTSKDWILKFKNLSPTLMPNDNYSKYIFSQINKLRTNPQSFIKIIEDSKKNIIKDKLGRIIYNGTNKILLKKGEQAFDEAIIFLKKMKPIEKLIFNPYIVADVPKTENEIRYRNDLRLKVENLANEGIFIKSFWRDIIKDPELSLLIMIIDDTGYNSGKRRQDLFDTNMKYIGINSNEINGNFCAYYTLTTDETI